MGQMCVHMHVGPIELVSTEVADHNMCLCHLVISEQELFFKPNRGLLFIILIDG